MNKLNKLDIIFKLDSELEAEEFCVGENRLGRFVVKSGISHLRVLQTLVSVMEQFRMSTDFSSRGSKFPIDSYLGNVETQGEWTGVENGELSFQFVHLPALKQSFLSIRELKAGAANSWESWVEPFLAEERFVQAWVSNIEYDYWQNAKDPLQYSAVGRSYEHLPTKSNGLPPPLEQLQIDTSSNPGRRTLRAGYVEAVGAVMWLGQPFWQMVGEHRKATLLAAESLDLETVRNGVIKVVAANELFCDTSTEAIQNKLRDILFG